MRLTPSVTWQEDGERVVDLFTGPLLGSADRGSFVHVVNLYRQPGSESLGGDQLATIESMRRAQKFSEVVEGARVDFVAVHEDSDSHLMPADFRPAPQVRRTIADLAGFEDGPRFPFVFDILAAAPSTVATHVVFTNADICLQPTFYEFVCDALNSGYDSLVVNRRTIDARALGVSPNIAGSELGEIHPGLDCFVFPRTWIGTFETNEACVGAGHVMRGVLHNLVAHAEALLVVTDAQLTYHFGDDRPWQSEARASYIAHNRREDRLVFDSLCEHPTHRAKLREFHRAKPKYVPVPRAATSEL